MPPNKKQKLASPCDSISKAEARCALATIFEASCSKDQIRSNENFLFFQAMEDAHPDLDGPEIALCLLKAHPDLARTRFPAHTNLLTTGAPGGFTCIFPLQHLVIARAKKQVIETVYHMFPDALLWKKDSTTLHLECWCEGESRGDVVKFLAEKCPAAVSFPAGTRAFLPIHIILRKKTSFIDISTLQALVKIYPGSLAETHKTADGDRDVCCLNYALGGGHSPEISEFIINETIQTSIYMFSYHDRDGLSLKLNYKNAAMLSNVLPKMSHLTRFICEPSNNGNIRGWKCLLDCLEDCRALKNVQLILPISVLTRQGCPSLAEAIHGFLVRKGDDLNCLGLEARTPDGHTSQVIDPLIQVLNREGCRLPWSLEVSNACLTDANHLKKLLCQGDSNLASVAVCKCSITNAWIPCLSSITSKLSELILSDLRLKSNKCYEVLLDLVVRLPLQLLLLSFKPVRDVDLTKWMVALLEQGGIKTLIIGSGIKVTMAAVCKALKTNKSLKSYVFKEGLRTETEREELASVLETHNTTLTWVKFPSNDGRFCQFRAKALYFLDLNRCGRCNARNPKTRLCHFLGTIATAKNEMVFRPCVEDIPGQLEIDLVYGLLRESPHLWSGQSQLEALVTDIKNECSWTVQECLGVVDLYHLGTIGGKPALICAGTRPLVLQGRLGIVLDNNIKYTIEICGSVESGTCFGEEEEGAAGHDWAIFRARIGSSRTFFSLSNPGKFMMRRVTAHNTVPSLAEVLEAAVSLPSKKRR